MVVVYSLMAFVFGAMGLLGTLRSIELLLAGSGNPMAAFYGLGFLLLAWKSFQKARAVSVSRRVSKATGKS
jgi:hypothetical protein